MDACSKLLDQFLDLRIGNLVYKSTELEEEVQNQYDEKASGFHESMKEAIKNIL